jgi:hypothetical protein
MRKYGYIIDNSYVPQADDDVWNFNRYNADGTITEYIGIETSQTTTSDKVVTIGDNISMRSWIMEYSPHNPDPLEEI